MATPPWVQAQFEHDAFEIDDLRAEIKTLRNKLAKEKSAHIQTQRELEMATQELQKYKKAFKDLNAAIGGPDHRPRSPLPGPSKPVSVVTPIKDWDDVSLGTSPPKTPGSSPAKTQKPTGPTKKIPQLTDSSDSETPEPPPKKSAPVKMKKKPQQIPQHLPQQTPKATQPNPKKSKVLPVWICKKVDCGYTGKNCHVHRHLEGLHKIPKEKIQNNRDKYMKLLDE